MSSNVTTTDDLRTPEHHLPAAAAVRVRAVDAQLSLFAPHPQALGALGPLPQTATAGARLEDGHAENGLAEERRPPVSRTRALVDAIHCHLPHARVLITDTRTVLLSQSLRGGIRTVRVHQMFLDAPAQVRSAMAHFLAHGDRRSGEVVDAFVEEQGHLLMLAARPLPTDAHRGQVHDLLPIYQETNRRYFAGAIDAELGWSQPGSPQRRTRRSITFGSYDARAKRIVIHPVLDQPGVPEVAVARVVHHEMLHAHHGAERDSAGRRIVHGPAFRADEARFHAASEADAWFDRHLSALLAWKPGRRLDLGIVR